MLKRVKIKNVALIDELEVTFSDHLNILTGETGAGKSILIDSIHLALGEKADKNIIRSGCEYAFVELEFVVFREETRKKLCEMEIFPEQDGTVLLQRRILPKKSTLKINGETVSLKTLKDAAFYLIDIHGQHEHQSLLNEKRHRELLDAYCGEKLTGPKQQLEKLYENYQSIRREHLEALTMDAGKERDISLAQFEWKEIQDANLSPGEDEELEKEFKKMDNVRFLGQHVEGAMACLESFDSGCAIQMVSEAAKSVKQAVAFDESLEDTSQELMQAEDMLRNSQRFLSRYLESLELDESRYAYVTQRLDSINHLKRKYGNSIDEILAYAQKQQEFLDKFEDFEQYKIELEEKLGQAKEKLLKACTQVSDIRRRQAVLLSEALKEALCELNFPHVEFVTQVEECEEHITAEGYDTVRFLISLNAGEALKPLTQVASGGELSRIMLALKSVMASQEEIESLIFDEIDAGISGKTAWKVSEKLAVLGREHQVICITHLPQIAAMADRHFAIEKTQNGETTKTGMTVLDREGEICELARLLGSDMMTDAVYENAKELKELATKTKGY